MTDDAVRLADGWKPTRHPSLSEVLGPLFARREGEAWAYGFRSQSRHLNNQGVVHGGMLTAFADLALGLVAWEANERSPCVTIQLNAHFVRGARCGDFIEARAEVVRRTGSLVFLRGALSVAGETVLSVDGVWRRLGRPAGAADELPAGGQPAR